MAESLPAKKARARKILSRLTRAYPDARCSLLTLSSKRSRPLSTSTADSVPGRVLQPVSLTFTPSRLSSWRGTR